MSRAVARVAACMQTFVERVVCLSTRGVTTRSVMCCTRKTLFIALVWGIVGCSSEPAAKCLDSVAAVESYLRLSYEFQKPSDRAIVLGGQGLKQVAWPELGGMFPGVEFFVFVKDFTNQVYGLVGIVEDCSAILSEGQDGVGLLLRLRPPVLQSNSDYEALAHLLVKMINVSGVYGDHYSDGVGIVEGLGDIRFESEDERREVEGAVNIVPPRLQTYEWGMEYEFYSWKGRSSLALMHNTLVWRKGEGVRFRWRIIKHDVGEKVPGS